MGRKQRRKSADSPRSVKSGRSRASRSSLASRASVARPLNGGVPPMEMDRGRDEAAVPMERRWRTGICTCGGSCRMCMYGLICIPCALATARHRFDGSSWCMNLLCLNICIGRNLIREGYMIEGHCCTDILCSIMCGPCVTCQLLGETIERGSVVERWSLNPHRPVYEQPWRFGLANCCEDISNCAYGTFCPCLALGSVRTQFDGSDCIFNCCCLNAWTARSIVRQGYNIEGTTNTDFFLTLCCYPCSVVQLLNETQHRGHITV
ncbi:unnamed protein product [Discosporangium mesarthrocarpum]